MKKKKKNRICLLYACMYALLLSLLYPCTLPTAPVSRNIGLRSPYESVSLTPTKEPGTSWEQMGDIDPEGAKASKVPKKLENRATDHSRRI